MEKFRGDRCREIRLAAKKTQTEVANFLNITQGGYGHFETGRRDPGGNDIYALAGFFGVSCEAFCQKVGTPIRWLKK